MKDIVALLTCCAMVYHYTVGGCFHAHCQAPSALENVASHDHHDCGGHHHHHADEASADEGIAEHGTPEVPTAPTCPHDDFHDAHGAATLVVSSYSHWGAAKAPVAVLDGPIVVACEQFGSCEPFYGDLRHDAGAKTRGDCYRGLGAFLS